MTQPEREAMAREMYARELDRDGEGVRAMLWQQSGPHHPDSEAGRIVRAMLAFSDREREQTPPDEGVVEIAAEAVHIARLAPGKAPEAWPLGVHFTERDYCRKLARAALEAVRVSGGER